MVRTIQRPDFVMAFEERGEGTPLLCIHGYPLNRMIWESQWEGLVGLAHMIIPDLRGHGESTLAAGSYQKPYPFTMDLLADDCVALIDAININRRVILCGLSMGGYVSLAFYRRYPDRVAGLILAATRAGADSLEARNNRLRAIDLVQSDGVEAMVETILPRMFSPRSFQTRQEVVERARAIMLSSNIEGVIGDSLGMKDRPDSTVTLGQISVPTLILVGADDQIVPRSEAEEMRSKIHQARLVILPEAGHLLNMEQPQLFNRQVREFIQLVDGESS